MHFDDFPFSDDLLIRVTLIGKAVPGGQSPGKQGHIEGTVRIAASEFNAADPSSVRAVVEDALDKLTYALAEKVDPDNFLRKIAADLAEMG